MGLWNHTCEASNTLEVLEDTFWNFSEAWTWHRIGWAIAGGCAALTTLITAVNLTLHATHYQVPAQQRQAMRILMMPTVYSVVSFCSYRYFREYTYFELAEVAYEGLTLGAFLLLLVEYVAESASSGDIRNAMLRKEKEGLPMTFGRIRYRSSKPYFLHALKWSVLQYALFRPLISIISIICEAIGRLCPDQYSVYFAELYLVCFDFVVISIALYGLILFYDLTKGELRGRQPLSKFLSIKLIVMATFYQSFIFSVLQSYGVIKATKFWTATNVSDALNALCICVEMVVFAIWMGFAFSYKEYAHLDRRPRTFKNYLQAIWDTVWFGDFAMEIWVSWVFFWNYMRGKPGTSSKDVNGFDHRLEAAFGVSNEDDEDGLHMATRPKYGRQLSGMARYDTIGSAFDGRSSAELERDAERGEEKVPMRENMAGSGGRPGRDRDGKWH